MVRCAFTISTVLLALVSTITALSIPPPLRPSREVACQPQSYSHPIPSVCSLPSPTTQSLERRAKSRKARAAARATKGLPRATGAEKGRTGAPRVKPKPPMKPKKVKKVQERKDDRLLAKKQKWATGMAKAKQKGVPPPYAIDAASGKLRKPVDADLAPKVLAKKQAAQDAKRLRKAAYDSKSPAEKAAHNTASATRQAASRQAHIDGNTKQNNRAKRVATKAAARQKGKAENNRHTTAARNAYTSAQGLPGRKETYASPQGKPYTGKDVRQAVFSSEVAQAKGRVGYNMFTGKQAKLVDSLPKPFENRPNSDGTTPLPGAAPQPGNPLNEFPIMHNARQGYDGRKPNPSDARIITQKNAAGQTELKGKIGHPAGTDDHVAF